jgi:hypothetical protein
MISLKMHLRSVFEPFGKACFPLFPIWGYQLSWCFWPLSTLSHLIGELGRKNLVCAAIPAVSFSLGCGLTRDSLHYILYPHPIVFIHHCLSTDQCTSNSQGQTLSVCSLAPTF